MPITAPAAAPTAAAVAAPVQQAPVTLHLAVSDGEDSRSGGFAREFIEQAKALSNGEITIEPVWDAGADTPAGYEAGVVQLVKEGQDDLGVAASRAWDAQDFPQMQVLQAPFLITNDALAEAVVTSTIATKLLDSLSSGGVVGLTLWPEDLRHPFSVDPAKPILSPADFAGLTVRTTDTGVSKMLIQALGGNPVFEADKYQGAESGLLQGATLTGVPAATGNVVFFPKYQVLFANSAALGSLSAAQQDILRQAAAVTQSKALAEHPREVDSAAAWCADGGTVVMASDAQVAAFERAAQPVFDAMDKDPANAELIAAIRELKTQTTPSAGASACAPAASETTPATPVATEAWSEGTLPNGTWQANVSLKEILAIANVLKSTAGGYVGLQTYTFHDGEYTWKIEGQNSEHCEGTYAVVGDVVRVTFPHTGHCPDEIDDVQWRLDDQGLLHLHLSAIQNAQLEEVKAAYDAKPFEKVADQ